MRQESLEVTREFESEKREKKHKRKETREKRDKREETREFKRDERVGK